MSEELKLVLDREAATMIRRDNREDALRDRIKVLEELLDFAIEMTGEPHCYHDHHGYCQAHNLQPRGECWVEQAQALIGTPVSGS